MALSVKLMVVGGEVKTTEIKLKLPAIIGRGKGCTIVLPHALVSRQHCELFERDGLLFARDLGSLNGTFVNSERVEEAPLPPENLLTVGAVTFRAQYDPQSELTAPPGAGPKAKSSRETETTGIPLITPAAPSRPPSPATVVVPPKPAPAQQTPQEPVDVEMDFDLDDATPMHKTAAPAPLPEPSPQPAPVAKAAPVAVPAAPASPAPAAKAAPAAKPAAPAEGGAGFGFLEPSDETQAASDEEDDDLQDFLKNLNK